MSKTTKEAILKKLLSLKSEKGRVGMARFGINIERAYGISIPDLRKIGKQIGKDHELALALWDSKIHEARILASIIDEEKLVTAKQMDEWADGFNSWDICDQCCGNLFNYTKFAHAKAVQWSSNKKEFVKRAGFSLMAYIAVHDKEAKNEEFIKFFEIIKRESNDERNFVKKAVNWALRQIGKRNIKLNKLAIHKGEEIEKLNIKSARWIASNALRELKSPKVKRMLGCS